MAPLAPYALPQDWALTRPAREPWWRIALWIVAWAFGIASAVVRLVQGQPGPAMLLLVVFGLVGFLAVGELWRPGWVRGRPELINSVVLTRAVTRPADSWVHFFRDSRVGMPVVIGLLLLGGPQAILGVWGASIAIGTGDAWWIVAVAAIVIASGVILLVAALHLAAARSRLSGFGRRLVGLSLGRSGLGVFDVGLASEIPWDEIRAVRAATWAGDRTAGDAVSVLVIETSAETHRVFVSDCAAHPWLVYCAVRFWLENPDERRELGTTFAQMRMLEWRRAILAMRHPDAVAEGVDEGEGVAPRG
jgi:hypothetical protein